MGDETIPFTLVNGEINLTYLQYIDLKNTGGYIYYDAGYRGMIVYNEGNGVYRAFERACPYDPRSSCDPLIVDPSGLFIKHECCNSSFNFNGNPMGGPASLDLLEYQTYVDGNYLKITN
jgi:hypothetical protein